jgi:hypothetical protein
VQVSNGVFTVQLDFGANPFSTGAARYLEIAVKKPSDAAYTTLAPRQLLSATPYALQSLNAATATTATNAQQLGGVAANQFVQTNDTRLTDARTPTAGSANYIQNTTSQQSSSNFNISGDGTLGGTLSANTVNAATQYNISGQPVLKISGAGTFFANTNTFTGVGAGTNTAPDAIGVGTSNSFYGNQAGNRNTTGGGNSFFGVKAGTSNTSGSNNTFFGVLAGTNNEIGFHNSFFGVEAGKSNTTGYNNTTIGFSADVGSSDLDHATAIGAHAVVSSSNTIVLGRSNGSDAVQIPGNLTVTGTLSKGSGSFKIDHPLDPANKYLYHSFVESPDMLNIYNGNVTTDERGEATIKLPDYFEALNRDFRYQLTVIGQFAQAIVLEKIKDNQFKLKTDKPRVEVSWQVTGIRHDKFAEDERIKVEVNKPNDERGKCLYAPACQNQ